MIDPVCLKKVIPGKNELTYTYKNKNHDFCTKACRKLFEENPKKYIKSMPSKRKGLWNRYLERLQKTTGGKPFKCCH